MADPFIIVDLNLLVSRERPCFGLCQQSTHPVLVGLLEIEVDDCPRCRSIEGCLIRFQYPTENSGQRVKIRSRLSSNILRLAPGKPPSGEGSTMSDLIAQAPALERIDLFEVVDGRVVEKPPLGALEVFLASSLMRWLAPFVDEAHLGCVVQEMLFLLEDSPELKRRPDLAFVSAERWPIGKRVPRTEAWDVIPDLAVEVISQSNTADEVAGKIEEYFHAGTRQVWVVYPVTSKVQVYESPTQVKILQVGDELPGDPLIPGFRLPLSVLFGEETGD
jgi:Uma2 family endonuclease